MTDISELVGGSAHAAPRPNVARGRIVRAPATTTDPLTVTLANYSSLYEYEVPALHWQPHGDALPTTGALCLVTFDDDGDAWVPAWEGETAPLPVVPLTSRGIGSVTFSASTFSALSAAIPHGLAVTPTAVVATSTGGNLITMDTNTYTSTTFKAYGGFPSSISGTFNFVWVAYA